MFHEEVLNDCVLFSCQPEDKHVDPKVYVDIAKKMQQLPGSDGNVVDERGLMQEEVGRRKTVLNIQETHHFDGQKKPQLYLHDAFNRRWNQIMENNGKNMIYIA
jgi:hypothetical protein